MKVSLLALSALVGAGQVLSFSPLVSTTFRRPNSGVPSSSSTNLCSESPAGGDGEWLGEVVAGGSIRGCKITPIGEDPVTEWELTIDGVEADLGRFSEAIYKKITADAKQQRFQGFRPGTIPPHLQPTYRAFTMDECARETVLEAMEQNNIRPFSTAREDITIEQVSIPPPPPKKSKKKKKGGKKKKKGSSEADSPEMNDVPEEEPPAEPQWRSFEDMKGAIDAGWKPGQSFSFVAKNVKGQKVLSSQDTAGAKPIGGLNF